MYKINQVNPAHKFKPMHTYLLAELGKDTPINDLPPIQESHLKFAHQNKDYLYEIGKILERKRGKVLIKWLGYEVPMWESNKIVK